MLLLPSMGDDVLSSNYTTVRTARGRLGGDFP